MYREECKENSTLNPLLMKANCTQLYYCLTTSLSISNNRCPDFLSLSTSVQGKSFTRKRF